MPGEHAAARQSATRAATEYPATRVSSGAPHLDSGDAGGASHQDDLVNVGVLELGILQADRAERKRKN
jgi:hypothetical protein